jgi:hypothetical protein
MAKQSNRESVVKRGGMAREPSDAEDVTRDTYGDLKPAPVNRDKEKRAAEASRLAAAAGIPGVVVPDTESDASSLPLEDQPQDSGASGNRTPPRHDVEKLGQKQPQTPSDPAVTRTRG